MTDFDDSDVVDELGFEPAVPATGAESTAGTPAKAARPGRARRRRRARPGGLRRRLGAAAVLIAALCAMGGSYALFATSSGAAPSAASAADIEAGRQLYNTGCITCHGANLEGVAGNGVPLIGTGSAAVYFQVSTGRMPLVAQGAYAPRKQAKYDEKQTEQLGAYVESIGGGPPVPTSDNLRAPSDQIGKGGELFRLNCASCHGATFRGAPLSAGKVAPGLYQATDRQIYSAMLSGPENMPVFSDNTITPEQKMQIIGYIQTLKASKDPGGNGIARIGPVSEAIVIWTAGVGALMVAILWIGARAR